MWVMFLKKNCFSKNSAHLQSTVFCVCLNFQYKRKPKPFTYKKLEKHHVEEYEIPFIFVSLIGHN